MDTDEQVIYEPQVEMDQFEHEFWFIDESSPIDEDLWNLIARQCRIPHTICAP